MAVAYTGISRLQDLSDVNITIGAGVDEYALCWDNDTSKFVLRQVAGVYLPLAGGTMTGALTLTPAATATMTDRALLVNRNFTGTTAGEAYSSSLQVDYTPGSSNSNVIIHAANFQAKKLGALAMGGASGALIGARFYAQNASTADVNVPSVIAGDFYSVCSSAATPTVGAGIAVRTGIIANDPITNAYGVQITTPTGGQVVNSYGLYVQAQNVGATLNYAIYTNAGEVRLGDVVNFAGTMGDSAKNPTSDAPADWVEIKIGANTYYLPAYAAS